MISGLDTTATVTVPELLLLLAPPPPLEHAASDSFNQLLTLYGQGKCAMWYDATVAATSIATTYPDVYKQTGYALAPVNLTKSSGWLWTWALGIPQGAPNSGAAWKFVSWATSKQYDQLVAAKYGWGAVPPGTRTSLYHNPHYVANLTLIPGCCFWNFDLASGII